MKFRKLKTLLVAALFASAPAAAFAGVAPGANMMAASSALETCHQFGGQVVDPSGGPSRLVGRIGTWWAGSSSMTVQICGEELVQPPPNPATIDASNPPLSLGIDCQPMRLTGTGIYEMKVIVNNIDDFKGTFKISRALTAD
jgi:hypothetical protein